jgi:tetratricopeptide (TPR) repeat protein
MSVDDLWNQWVEPYDLFISYARADNAAEPHMVSALVEHIKADFARFPPSTPLKVFFDKESILNMEYWRDVLKKGLRQSKVMLAILSKAYFQSEWCRREWEEYELVEQGRTYPGEALAPIFIIAPADLDKVIPDAARDWWHDVTSRNAVVEIHPFWPMGRQALQEQVVRKTMQRLAENVRSRVEHGRVLAAVPRNLAGRNPNFVGRRRELAALRDALSRHEMVGLCAVNGVGGIGKSAMAREYAYLFRKEYLGGEFEIDLSTVKSIAGVQTLLVGIARDYLKAPIAPALTEAEQYRLARAAFDGLPAGVRALLIFDNLNEDATALVGRSSRAALPSAEKVHLLVTTRADPRSLGGMEAVSLDVLPVADALDLLFRYRQFARKADDPDYLKARNGEHMVPADPDDTPADQEWKAALSIVNRLGRHALAVALVGAFLGSYPDVSYARFSSDLAAHGIGLALDAVGPDEKVRNLIEHPAKLIGDLFEQSVARLTPLALRALEYAAFLPPDLVPLAWLKELVSGDAEVAVDLEARPFQPPPWEETSRTLAELQYLVGSPYGRMHRVVQEVVKRRRGDVAREQREKLVLEHVRARVKAWTDKTTAVYPSPDEVSAAEQVLRDRASGCDPRLGLLAASLVRPLLELGRLSAARDLATIAAQALRRTASTGLSSVEKQRAECASFIALGSVSLAEGDLRSAMRFFEDGLPVARELYETDPGSLERFHVLCRLGDVKLGSGDLSGARTYFEESLNVARRDVEAYPDSTVKQTNVSISMGRLGDVCVAEENLAAARALFEQALRAVPSSAYAERQRSILIERLGTTRMWMGDLSAAREWFDQYIAIARKRAEAHPDSAERQMDLSISLGRLGALMMKVGDFASAREYLVQQLGIVRKLSEDDPDSGQKRDSVFRALGLLSQICTSVGDAQGAVHCLEESLGILRKLASAYPTAERRRELGVWLIQLGKASMASGRLVAARAYFEEGLAIRAARAQTGSRPAREALLRTLDDLADTNVQLEDFARARECFKQALQIREDFPEAERYSTENQLAVALLLERLGSVSTMLDEDLLCRRKIFERALAIRRSQSEAEPGATEKQQRLSGLLSNLGGICALSGDLSASANYFEQALSLRRALAEADPTSADAKRNLADCFRSLGGVMSAMGDAHVSLDCYLLDLATRIDLLKADPDSVKELREVGRSHLLIAEFAELSGNTSSAVRHLTRFIATWGRLDASGHLPDPSDQAALRNAKESLVKLEGG